ncbi:MAG: hypothetical protein KAS04_06850 [Candidatus Aenigmarchaeota archaeon]|nr:hypothetical protein [Candidatus Aenigmarchaeota archaeon]
MKIKAIPIFLLILIVLMSSGCLANNNNGMPDDSVTDSMDYKEDLEIVLRSYEQDFGVAPASYSAEIGERVRLTAAIVNNVGKDSFVINIEAEGLEGNNWIESPATDKTIEQGEIGFFDIFFNVPNVAEGTYIFHIYACYDVEKASECGMDNENLIGSHQAFFLSVN